MNLEFDFPDFGVYTQAVIDTFQKLADAMRDAAEKTKPIERDKPWPQVGDTYYTFDLSSENPVEGDVWDNLPFERRMLDNGIMYRTKEEATQAYRHTVMENDMRAAANVKHGEIGFMLYHIPGNNHISIEKGMCLRGVPMFETEEKARQFIEDVGEENIINYWFEA